MIPRYPYSLPRLFRDRGGSGPWCEAPVLREVRVFPEGGGTGDLAEAVLDTGADRSVVSRRWRLW